MVKIVSVSKVFDDVCLTKSDGDDAWLDKISNPNSIITPTNNFTYFPESLESNLLKYRSDIEIFSELIEKEKSTNDVFIQIRGGSYPSNVRMSLLKLFRRCVSPVLDTETTKKVKKITTQSLIDNYSHTFKDISLLKEQFVNPSEEVIVSLCALLGEYDSRGTVGYELTDIFFDWFEGQFFDLFNIKGPRGAGRDIELKDYLRDFEYDYPCDFVITGKNDNKVIAVGFARYDSTRGGSQADDRTGGNSDKVWKAIDYMEKTGNYFKLIFLSDGPGLAHKDIWAEFVKLDAMSKYVRVTTLKTLDERVNETWLLS